MEKFDFKMLDLSFTVPQNVSIVFAIYYQTIFLSVYLVRFY